MRKSFILLIFTITIALTTNAQSWVADSIEMGASYSHDVYYDLSTGDDYRKVADDWDIAFQMTAFRDPMFNASVRANHIKRGVQVYSLHKKASTSFGTLTAADTMVTLSDQLVNQDSSWGRGAFTNNKDTTSYDYGWGRYDPVSHFLNGDSLYLVKANGVFYQLWIQQYISFGAPNSIGYKFRVAKWDGTNDKTDSIKRVAPYTDRLFAYYDFAAGTFSDREPSRKAWDLLFRQYQKDGQKGNPDTTKLQAYSGVLVNLGVHTAKLTSIDPTTVSANNYLQYLSMMDKATNAIGDDWKYLDHSTFQYVIKADTSFIIKTDSVNGKEDYYHLRFTRFDGGSGGATGTVVFEKRLLATNNVGVDEVGSAKKAAYSIYPNPTSNSINIMLDAAEAQDNTVLLLTDITGKTVLNTQLTLAKGINAYNVDMTAYPSGTYLVTVANANWKITDKVVVQH